MADAQMERNIFGGAEQLGCSKPRKTNSSPKAAR